MAVRGIPVNVPLTPNVLMPADTNVTQLLVAWSNGDAAAFDRLEPAVHQELRRLASRYMAGERPGHVLQTTALVNEAYLRLVDWRNVEWQSRAHFFGMAAQVMRRILVDVARTSRRDKRGGRALHVSLTDAADVPMAHDSDLVALDDALTTLERLNARHSRVVELRFFGGLNLEETAHVLGVSVGTVRRDWSLAQAWLFRELSRTGAQ
jgi:RNA polymerase sigma-70 factor, ECF subfamily